MKSAIFSFIAISDNSMVASVKVAQFLAKELSLPLVWTADIAKYENLDALIIVNGAFGFCRFREQLAVAVRSARKIIWVQQDYSIVPPINDGSAQSPMRRAFVERREKGLPHLEFWTTCEKESKATPLSAYINWNALSMRNKPLKRITCHSDTAYYGSFRVGRIKSFDNFFMSPRSNMIISSPSSRFEQEYGGNELVKFIGIQDDLLRWLNERGAGLYLEDNKSHKEYHSPPNRFYEMLSAGLPMFFEQAAGPTLRKAGYNPNDYVVNHALDLARRWPDAQKFGKEQYERWWKFAIEEKAKVNASLKNAWEKLKENA